MIPWLTNDDSKAVFVPIGANLPEPAPVTEPASNGNRLGKTVAIYCLSGNPHQQRELYDISLALQSAASDDLKLRVVFLGRGTSEAKEQIGDLFKKTPIEVANLGIQNAENVSRILAESDALLCVRGSLYPRRGSAIAGIACGVPTIGYAGAAEGSPLIEAGVELVPKDNREALGKALRRVLTDPDYANRLRERNRKAQRKYFSWDAIAGAFADSLYRENLS